MNAVGADHGGSISLLEAAVRAARRAGHRVSGWSLQQGDGGYVAWLYFDDGDTQNVLDTGVQTSESADEAAAACFGRWEQAGG